MVGFLKNISIRNKLISIQLITAFAAIILVSVFGLLTATRLFSEIQNRSIASLADFIGSQNEAALIFDMPQSTDFSRTDKAVSNQEIIENYTIYDNAGRVFHEYKREGFAKHQFNLPIDELKNAEGFFDSDSNHSNYYHPLVDEEKNIWGYVCIRSNKSQEQLIQRRYIFFTIIVLALAAIIVAILSTYLQKGISSPILKLVNVVKKISKHEDYNTRVDYTGSDEVAILSKEFNNMIRQINERDKKLMMSNNILETRVEQKTRALREAYNTLEKRSIELESINRELEQFAYVASHDLQEPLRTIGSFTQLLNRKMKVDAQSESGTYMSFIVQGVERMQSVIRDLLLFSGLGRNKLNFELTDLGKLLNEVLFSIKASVDESQAQIKVENKLPTILVDASQLRHLFQNLLSNAIKFRAENEPLVQIDCKELENHWQFSFKDNGIGIEKEYAHKIFLIFQRLHTKEEYPGTGIGLAICKKIVDYHKGRIWFDSEKNNGSTFHFTINKNPLPETESVPVDGLFDDVEIS